VLVAGGQLDQAQQVLDALPAELTPAGRITALQTRADLLTARKHWPEARRELQKLLELAPLNGRALLSLGNAYAAEDDLPRATFAFEAAAQVPEATYRANLELANIELKNRHYDKSVTHLEAALKIEKTAVIEDYLARVKILAAQEAN
jgi:tetratricopeptide (TPR) repeat protein